MNDHDVRREREEKRREEKRREEKRRKERKKEKRKKRKREREREKERKRRERRRREKEERRREGEKERKREGEKERRREGEKERRREGEKERRREGEKERRREGEKERRRRRWRMGEGEGEGEPKRSEEKQGEARRSKPCATSNSVNIDWSHLGDYLKEATAGRDDDLESEGTHIPQDLAVSVHEEKKPIGRVDALDWLNKNQLADLKSYDRATLSEPRSNHPSHPDKISAMIVCWCFRDLLTSLVSNVQSS